ncbi:Condensation domain-containing protein [Actinokineospora alba]|uniref:Condensation domain-containing protein n=1 Tax=Actinokineospora alba TaxID=504798 RepID=A0A1H0FDB3_9PSEU|nr:condensation domain-containing protein [Actinokineospora alba]TDP69432.1 condensation domain-containing protein [Actinokineospora alba]SDI16938.1 Condensation domain-containing protein [Actinokineospora alba]SDN92556.1 Condensation domain-containing protein [Actinokineospora alba]
MSTPLALPTLSYQEGRLLMDQRCRAMGVPSVRTIAQAYRVTGPLDLAVLDQALAVLTARHAALRASFPDGAYGQTVYPHRTVHSVLFDAGDEAAAIETVRAEADRPLPADQPERLRVSVVRVADDDNFVVLVFDHLVVDAWARGVLMDELSAIYRAIGAGEVPDVPELGYTYEDYVRAQADLLAGPDGQRMMAFWREQLAETGAIPRLDVPKLPAGLPAEGGYATRTLPADLVADVRRFAARERVTLFMLVLCALQLALRERTAADQQSVAVNVYNRETVDRENLVAPLAELLVVRTDLAGAETFRDALRRVRAGSLDAQDNGAVPFAELVKTFNPDEYADPDAPIGVVLNMLYAQVHGGGLDLAPATTATFPLSDEGFRPRSELMVVGEAGDDELRLSAYYQADRLSAEFVTGLLDAVSALLAAAAADPLLPIERDRDRV